MRVGIVGGGLAGLSAALRLVEHGHRVRLLEARHTLGGRAGSWREPGSGDWLDHCQHVSMGCCTNLADFLRRAELEHAMQRFRVLHFIDRAGQRSEFRALPFLPAPLHLLGAFRGMHFLSWKDRIGLAWSLFRMARQNPASVPGDPTILEWLRGQHVAPSVVQRFWVPVLVSALSEQIDRIQYASARKVIIDGFLAARAAFYLDVPQIPLGELYDVRLRAVLERGGAELCTNARVRQVDNHPEGGARIELHDGTVEWYDQVILAVPWRQAGEMLSSAVRDTLHHTVDGWNQLSSGSIAALHLWFDRPIFTLPHAVLLERYAQWVFAHGLRPVPQMKGDPQYYYQVVISAVHQGETEGGGDLIERVVAELRETFAEARSATLIHALRVTQSHAVFAPVPESDLLRPLPETLAGALVLAGDWTRTGWPATMEGAVISGYRAAECVLNRGGAPQQLVVDPLKRGWLARRLIREDP